MPTLNSTTLALLRYSKRNLNGEKVSWRDVVDALKPVYGFQMTLEDLMQVLLREYGEVMNEKRFEFGSSDTASRNLLLAPIKGHFAVEFMGPRSLDVKYSVEEFYNAMVREIVSAFRVARIDWCRDEVFPANAENAAICLV
ncbi:MAG: hypothetical protein PHQ60_02300 [Sideroxydans sp.]|nr:hypothetical protein [Sideroxydans sp.]MDD5056675.1 hypothetical protein [Sideroxydans sp.]